MVNKMNLSKSKYCAGVQCRKILWLDKNYPEEREENKSESVLDNGKEVGIVARDLFGPCVTIEFNTDLDKMVNDTKDTLTKHNVIAEASFIYNDNFCSIDILKKDIDGYEIYEVKSSTEIKDIFLDDISYQYYVVNNLGYKITRACIVYLNSSYVRGKCLELDKLFVVEDVTDIVISKQKEVEDNIREINEYVDEDSEKEEILGMQCVTPYDCPYFKYCTKELPERNVFTIRDMRKSSKFKLYQNGIYRYEDLLKEKINPKYKEQIEFELYDREDVIKEDEIRSFMETLSYPIYFLDFETYQQAIPEYEGIRPYMQIPFQYSLHYLEEESGTLKHKEFLADSSIDPRRTLAEKLVSDIPLDVCTVAYNMKFEKMVIKNLADLYPDLSDHLMNIYENMKDLMIPFYNRSYYTKDMKGSYSIKYVLPALFPNDESLNYKNLDLIHNGSEAMSAFANLGSLSKDEQENIRYNLLKYCELDTYAMVKIWERLKEI